jgi:hypothetical protein
VISLAQRRKTKHAKGFYDSCSFDSSITIILK